MLFDRSELDNFLIERKCVGFFDPPIKLKSGRDGYYYINIRDAITTKEDLHKIAKFAYNHAMDLGLRPDQFIGIPEGATQIGEEATKLIDYSPADKIPMTILRNQPKDHGEPKDRYSVGPLTPGNHAILIEDVSTTGGSGEPKIMSLQESGVLIDKFLSIASRLERRDDGRTVEQAYREKYGVSYDALTDITTLLPKAYAKLQPPRRIAELSEKYSQEFCSVPVKLLS
jgi:orotate phosphoribosyltransferase